MPDSEVEDTRYGVVASGHALVSDAAAEVLRAGGNAFDAVIAAGCASAVAEPGLTSLGGGGFLLARSAQGAVSVLDFFVDTPGRGLDATALEPHFVPITVHFPGSDQIFNVGLGSVAVPGNVRGFVHAHGRFGRMPLRDVLAPAIALARDGVELTERQAYVLALLEPVMTLTPAGRALWSPRERYVRAGERVAMPELADFLDQLAREGDRDFYEGEIAARIERDMREGQGLLTRADLAAYRVIERAPLEVGYRGFRLLTNPPPSFGGSLLALGLRIAERIEPAPALFGSSEHLSALAAVQREVEACRDRGRPGPDALSEAELDESAGRVRRATRGTTHVSVWDRQGNAASMTTSNGEASGYVVPGAGVMLNNMLGEDDLHPDGFHASPPGQRVASMMSPSLLLEGAAPRLVLGSGGSKRIRSAIHQVVSNFVDFRMDVGAAVEAPRIHWDGASLQVEPGFAASELARLRAVCPINEWPVLDLYFGGVNAVSTDGRGAGDPRRGGAAARS